MSATAASAGETGTEDQPKQRGGALIASLIANLGVAVAKFVAYLITGAAPMLAEAIHSCVDSGNQILLMRGAKVADRPADETHPFGYGRVHYLSAFLVAMLLFTLGGAWAVYDGLAAIREPEPSGNPTIAFIVLGIAMILEGTALYRTLKETKDQRKRLPLFAWLRRTHSVDHIELVLEDSAAVIGLVLAAVGIVISQITGNSVYEGVATLLIGLLLIVVAVFMFVEVRSLLIGEAALPADRAAIRNAAAATPEFDGVLDLRTQQVAPDELFVAIKVGVHAGTDATTIAHAIDAFEARVREALPDAKMIFVEPDIPRG